MELSSAITQRQATRAFLDQSVSETQLRRILELAGHSPSGVNMQPWRVAVVQGDALHQLSEALLTAREQGESEQPDYRYYPDEWFEPYKGRRKENGLALYKALEIGREDHDKRLAAWNNNYRFFGAPVGLLVFVDKRLNKGSWLDLGMFIQTLMLAACNEGLATCPQASLADYPELIRTQLGIDDQMALACGIALGYADPNAPANSYRSTRVAIDAFTSWHS